MSDPTKSWTLTAPDGRQWSAPRPTHTLVALAMSEEPDFAAQHLDLARAYGAKTTDDLIDKMDATIKHLQRQILKEPT